MTSMKSELTASIVWNNCLKSVFSTLQGWPSLQKGWDIASQEMAAKQWSIYQEQFLLSLSLSLSLCPVFSSLFTARWFSSFSRLTWVGRDFDPQNSHDAMMQSELGKLPTVNQPPLARSISEGNLKNSLLTLRIENSTDALCFIYGNIWFYYSRDP